MFKLQQTHHLQLMPYYPIWVDTRQPCCFSTSGVRLNSAKKHWVVWDISRGLQAGQHCAAQTFLQFKNSPGGSQGHCTGHWLCDNVQYTQRRQKTQMEQLSKLYFLALLAKKEHNVCFQKDRFASTAREETNNKRMPADFWPFRQCWEDKS